VCVCVCTYSLSLSNVSVLYERVELFTWMDGRFFLSGEIYILRN